jgi:serine/threonine-protein kinase
MKRCPICAAEYDDDVRFCKNDGSGLRAQTSAADLVGQVVADRYLVLRKLGEGGMGQVYLAEHVKMGRRSAIKVMHPAMVHDPDAIARFNREAANAARITHQHVCAIYDFGETPEGLIYLAMELVDGEPLTELLEREGVLAPERAGRIFLQVAEALQAAHDLGIVHRDLKPDNIMLARGRGGEGDVVKVVDFGIAKAAPGAGDDASQKVTKTGLVVGTPEFMSPEQLAGDPVDGRSDLYALGLVLFRMLTGKLPFAADTVQEMMVKRFTDAPLTLAQARPDLRFPPALQACLDAALARSPLDRYQAAGTFAAEVMDALRLGAAGARKPGVPTTRGGDAVEAPTRVVTGARPRRRAALAPVAIAAVVLAVGGGAWAALSRRDAAPAPAPVPAQTETSEGPAAARAAERRVEAPRLDPARARAALDELFLERLDAGSAPMVRDSARRLHDTPGLGPAERAYAAFVVGQAYLNLPGPDGQPDRLAGCEWIGRAARGDPSSAVYRRVAQECET